MNGEYGVRDVCLSVPTEVGCGGVRKTFELAVSPKEKLGIQNSARVLRDTIDAVNKRLAAGPAVATPSPAAPAATPVVGERVIPRAAWTVKK
jgi:L-lactate dehydrogenase